MELLRPSPRVVQLPDDIKERCLECIDFRRTHLFPMHHLGKDGVELGRIGFAREALAAYFCAIDPQTPARTKAILLAALAYFIAPVDLVPDIIAGLGFTDDAAVLFAAWRSVEPHIKERHRERAKAALDDGQLSPDSVD